MTNQAVEQDVKGVVYWAVGKAVHDVVPWVLGELVKGAVYKDVDRVMNRAGELFMYEEAPHMALEPYLMLAM
jgi:hypothetical protein